MRKPFEFNYFISLLFKKQKLISQQLFITFVALSVLRFDRCACTCVCMCVPVRVLHVCVNCIKLMRIDFMPCALSVGILNALKLNFLLLS